MEHSPRVSIIIPTYNQASFLQESLDSCINQTYSNIEIIVVNDGSTDNTVAVLESNINPKLKVIHQENQGASTALNRGLTESTGEYICWLSSDDVFLKTKIEKQIAYAKLTDDKFDLIHTDYYNVDKEGELLGLGQFANPSEKEDIFYLLKNNIVNGSTALIRRSMLESVGGFDTKYLYVADGKLWLDLLLNGAKFSKLPIPLLKYRKHDGNQSSQVTTMVKYTDVFYAHAFRSVDLKMKGKLELNTNRLIFLALDHYRNSRYLATIEALNRLPSGLNKILSRAVVFFIKVTHRSYLKDVKKLDSKLNK